MTNTAIYEDIAKRGGGDIYIGVVGPVRSGKSTFIKRFMDTAVIPNIEGDYDRRRATDELPQSAGGRTVMTTEPKFIPDEAVTLTFGDSARMNVKMIDCVGYLVPDALGNTENGEVRMVNTPWSDEPMPFEEAAELGTKKVIEEHSTIGMVITTDGSFGDFSRESYVNAEERVVSELAKLGKPYAIIINSAKPDSDEATALALQLEEKYNAPVALVNCLELNSADINGILEMLLLEFPVREIRIKLPGWASALDSDHRLMKSILDAVSANAADVKKMGEIGSGFTKRMSEAVMKDDETGMASVKITDIDMGVGTARLELELPDKLYYRIIGEMTGIAVESQGELLTMLKSLAEIKREYDKFSAAIDSVDESGYGIVMPDIDDLTLEEPEIVKQAGGYGVKLRASAPSVHMIRAVIETEINPIVGSEQQSEDLVKYMLHEFEEDPKRIWESNLFGKSLYELVNEGLHTKLEHMPDDARQKLAETLSRIINEGSSGLICIIL